MGHDIQLYYKPDINALAQAIVEWRKSKGFKTDITNVPEKLFLIITELAEAGEEYRYDPTLQNKKRREHFTEEIADTFIRLLDLSGSLQLDIATAIHNKMLINEKRPMLHGKKL